MFPACSLLLFFLYLALDFVNVLIWCASSDKNITLMFLKSSKVMEFLASIQSAVQSLNGCKKNINIVWIYGFKIIDFFISISLLLKVILSANKYLMDALFKKLL